VPLETDVLSTNKNAMFALGQFAQDVFGTSTIFSGLACVPNTPAAMNVIVQPGAVYAQAALDATAYSSLAADSTVTMKQGILKAAQTFATPAPVTAGQSIVYLISGAFLEADTGATVLPYYNASNPAQAYSGPNNLGASQNTLRQDTVQLTLTAGVPATTGSQLAPATPVGQAALYTITVAYGASTVVAGSIAKAAGAPFLANNLLSQINTAFAQIQARAFLNGDTSQSFNVANAASSQNALPLGQATGRLLRVTAFSANGTFNPGAGTTAIKVRIVGGGGAGGGAPATAAGQVSVGSGGGAGGYGEGYFTSGFAGAAVTIGNGGTPVIGAAGGNGGATSFGGLMTANGGMGGGIAGPSAPPFFPTASAGGSAGSGGYINSVGGGSGSTNAVNTATFIGSQGGNSVMGGGGALTTVGSGGVNSNNGGGGGGTQQGPSGAACIGGIGGKGICIIEEFGTI
jgi:hypothetical protein